jgi:hypothetical protein
MKALALALCLAACGHGPATPADGPPACAELGCAGPDLPCSSPAAPERRCYCDGQACLPPDAGTKDEAR